MVDIGLSGNTTITRSRPVASSCLKRTVKLANSIRDTLTQHLIFYPKYWGYPDRVFCWLHPEFKPDIDAFHKNNGPPLRNILSSEKIDELDIECALSLRKKVPKQTNMIADIDLLSDFYRVKNNLGKTPTLTELGRYGKYSQRIWNKKFGSYIKFLGALGLSPPGPIITNPKESTNFYAHLKPQDILIKIYEEAYSRLGRVPQITEIPIWNPKQFNNAVEHYGGWKKFVYLMKNHGNN